jgi:hypothetical protein
VAKKSIHQSSGLKSPPPYIAEPTARRFHQSAAMVRYLNGPLGSGKSSACAYELQRRAFAQKPYEGVRRTRWAIIRETYGELARTTLKTFCDWIPEGTGPGYSCIINHQPPMIARLNVKLEDETEVDAEFVFIALESAEDEKKLRSWDLTGGWINEARYIEYCNFLALRERIGRYPAAKDGGMSWHGIIIDSNPPSNKHWLFDLFEVQKPLGYEIFKQPPAVLPMTKKDPTEPTLWVFNAGQDPRYPPCENVNNHNKRERYWLDLTIGVSDQKIRVDLMGEYGTSMEGKPVFTEYNDMVHCAKQDIEPMRGVPLLLQWDFGLTPVCLISQLSPRGQFVVIDELITGLTEARLEGLPRERYFGQMGIRQFANTVVKPYLFNHYHGIPFMSVGDPAGNQRNVTDEVTCMQELEAAGIHTEPARTQNFIARREAVAGFLQRMLDGLPGFLLSPRCQILREAMIGEYRYKKLAGQSDQYAEEPEKNYASHCADALQYGCMQAEYGINSAMESPLVANTMRSGRRRVVRVRLCP